MAVASLVLLSLPGAASAFTVLQTGDGIPLQWHDTPIEYYVGPLSEDLPEADQLDAIEYALDTWENVPGVSYAFEFMGFTDVRDDENDGINAIYFQDEGWNHSNSAVAITRTWAVSSGRIDGFDLMLNDDRFRFTSTDDEEDTSTDLKNTLTHEVGHILGLDHSHDPAACMYATAVRGETSKRSLSEDDIEAVQWLYPAAWFKGDSSIGVMGCDTSGDPASSRAFGLCLLGGLAAMRLGRRRRQSR